MAGLSFISSCARKPENVPVARIADRVITAEEFAFAYEMAPRSITNLGNKQARQMVLDQLIGTILLARQAEKQKLGEDTLLQQSVDLYKRLAINRELYLKHVRKPVKIAEPEERQAFEYSKITLFVRHFSSDQFDLANQVSAGILKLKHTPIFKGVRQVSLPEYGIVDQIKWRDIPEGVATVLYQLPLRQYSKPYFDGRYYHVFQVVEEEKEALLRENDFQANRESLNGILRKRKEQKASGEYVQKIMSDENVIIKAKALNSLTEEVWKNRPTTTAPLEQYITNQEINSITMDSRAFMNDDIAEFASGRMTVADLLINYKVNPVKIAYESKMAVRESLKNAAGMYVRDRVLSEQGIKERLYRRPSVIAEETTRREHLLMRKMLAQIGREYYAHNPDPKNAQASLDSFIADYTVNLRNTGNVKIYNENLMAVKTTDANLARKIDFVAFHTQ